MSNLIETDRLVLREWHDDDMAEFARINADPLIMEYMPRVLPPKDSDKLVKRFRAHFKKHGYGMYALERKEDGVFMGTVGLNHVEIDVSFAPAVEIAWRLDYGFWGQGYATEAARAVLHAAFERFDLKEVVAFTVHDNERSTHVMEKLGMSRIKSGDFDYPGLPKGHPLGRFVLYKIRASQFTA